MNAPLPNESSTWPQIYGAITLICLGLGGMLVVHCLHVRHIL